MSRTRDALKGKAQGAARCFLAFAMSALLAFGLMPTQAWAVAGDAAAQAAEAAMAAGGNGGERTQTPDDDAACYVSGFRVKTALDGTAPFDADDAAGNDSGERNGIVRSFDHVSYTLEYTTALSDPTVLVNSANVRFEAVLDCDPRYAEFNPDAMNWCLDMETAYVYEDGSQSAEWDQSRTVAKQVVTGYRAVSNTDEANAIPGAGTLSAGVEVKGAPNGMVLAPSFKVWVEGGTTTAEAVAEDTVVSAEPRYNIEVKRQTSFMDKLSYFDAENGTVSREDVEGTAKGRHEGYGITLQLYNDSAAKGLKGIELPQGDITFDLTMKATLDGEDVSTGTEWSPYLWDYRDNNASGTGLHAKGTLGRDMAPYQDAQSYTWQSTCWNVGTPSYTSAPGGGSFSVVQDAADPTVQHVTLSGYSFDWDDYEFPDRFSTYGINNAVCYPENVGCFSVLYVHYAAQFPRSVDGTENLQVTLTASNLQARTLSGAMAMEDAKPTDNASGFRVTLYAPGSISKHSSFQKIYGGTAGPTVWSAGDSFATPGSLVSVANNVCYSGDRTISAINILSKFDDDLLYAPERENPLYEVKLAMPQLSSYGSVATAFAAKPDKSGWTDQAEMNTASEENLVYFDTLDELESAGYTCVGYLLQIRDAKIYGARNEVVYCYTATALREDAEPGKVATVTNDVRVWFDGATCPEWKAITGENESGMFGEGDASIPHKAYVEGYTAPSEDVYYSDYTPTKYENGTIVGGHTGGVLHGDSCLVVGARNGVSISSDKAVYDLDAGERTATFTIQPTLTPLSSSGEVTGTGAKTDVTVTAELPKDLAYVTGSSNMTPDSVVEHDDGTSIVTWVVKGAQVGAPISPITLDCEIGAAGTADDVHNNDTISIDATVSSPLDSRKVSALNGTLATTTITVVRLATTAVSKTVDAPLMELGDENAWTLRFGNSSEETANAARLFDALPYAGDGRGSDFAGIVRTTGVTIDLADAPGLLAALKGADGTLRYSTNEASRSLAPASALNGACGSWPSAGKPSVEGSVLSWSVPEDATAVYLELGDVGAHEYAQVRVEFEPDGAEPGDVFANSFAQYCDNQAAVVQSNVAKTTVAERSASGRVWLDADGDGVQDDGERAVEGIDVTLYRTNRSQHGGEAERIVLGQDGVELFPAYDVFGGKVGAVRTGADGSWAFEALEAGDYRIVIEGADVSSRGLSPRDAAADDKDSDARATLEDGRLALAWHALTLPALEDMTAPVAESPHNDTGLVEYAAEVSATKVEAGTEAPLSGAELAIEGDGGYLEVSGGRATGALLPAAEGAAIVRTGADGRASVAGVPLGDYRVIEVAAPEGYAADALPVNVSVEPGAFWGEDGEPVFQSEAVVGALGGEAVLSDTPLTTSVTVEKAWDDDGDRDGLRADAVFTVVGTVQVDGQREVAVERDVTLPAEGAESAAVAGLPAFSHGQRVEYSVTEAAMEGYEASLATLSGSWRDGYRVEAVNAHEPASVDVRVTKAWDDDDDRDGLRPDAVSVVLTGSDGSERKVQLTKDGGWEAVIEGVPLHYDHGRDVEYALAEEPVDGYATVVEGAAGAAAGSAESAYTVTNVHKAATVDVPVTKEWDDDGDRDGLRPEAVTVVLEGSDGSCREMELTAEGGWQGEFAGLPKYHDGGVEVAYTVTEKPVEGYTAYVEGSVEEGFVIANRHEVETVDVPVSKTWDDDDDRDGLRPAEVAVTLRGSDGSERTMALKASAGWQGAFRGLPKYHDHGKEVVYELSEEPVEGYEASVVATAEGGFALENAHDIEVADVEIVKAWDDADDQDGERPESITVVLTGSDGSRREVVLDEEGGWKAVVAGLPVNFEHGATIDWAVSETPVGDYASKVVKSADGRHFTVTNSRVPATVDVPVVKSWDDDGDRDGLRPDAVTYVLRGSDGTVVRATASAEDGFSRVFAGLPKFHDGGKLVEWTLEEEPVVGYESSVDADGEGGFRVVNRHEVGLRDIPVSKAWEDAEDQDGLRPDAVTVVLEGSDGSYRELELTAEGGWQGAFVGLPRFFDHGTEVVYELSEEAPEGYTASVEWADGAFSVVNSHEPEKVATTVRKVWDDAGDQDGLRPASVVAVLTGDDGTVREVELSADGGWEAVVEGLPKYRDHGVEVSWTLEERAVEGYESAVRGSLEEGFVVENAHDPEVRSVAVEKRWEDADDQDGIRPDAVRMVLKGTDGSVREADVEEDGGWRHEWTGLPRYMDHGVEIGYWVEEAPVAGYAAVITAVGSDAAYTVVNSHDPAVVDVPVEKLWSDDADRDGLRPDAVTVVLTGDDGTERKMELDAEGGWKGAFEGLPKYRDGGVEVAWSLSEEPVEGYAASVSGSAAAGFVVENAHEAATLDVAVSKVWDDDEDRDGLRPDSVKVALEGSDGSRRVLELTEEGGWRGAFEGLPVYHDGGEKIEWSLSESPVEGYATEVEGSAEEGFRVVNRHEPEVLDIPVEKAWDDAEDQDGLRPESVVVVLEGSDGSARELEFTAEDGWKGAFVGLPRYFDHGTEVEWSLSERDVQGYEASFEGSAEEGFRVVNRHVPEVLDVGVEKRWDDADDWDGLRPDSVVVELSGSNGDVVEVELTAADGWKATAEGLARYEGGEPVVWSAEECPVEGYEASVSGSAEEGFLVVNRHVPEKATEPGGQPGEPEPPAADDGGHDEPGAPAGGGAVAVEGEGAKGVASEDENPLKNPMKGLDKTGDPTVGVLRPLACLAACALAGAVALGLRARREEGGERGDR